MGTILGMERPIPEETKGALVYLQIGLLCLQIVIIKALIVVSYGDLVLGLDRKVPGNQMVCIVFPAPSPV
jgi:hypothetical protein